MQKSIYFVISLLLLGAYLLSACSGTIPQSTDSVGIPKVQANDVVFTGVVEAIDANQWTISGQQVSVDASTAVDPNIRVGDTVKVEASVGQDGVVVAAKVEASSTNDDNANSNSSNDNSSNANDNTGNSNDGQVDDNSNSANDNGNNFNGNDAGEISGVVEAMTTDSITINGISYGLAGFTEFKDMVAVGDQVKIHVILNTDGTFTIREIENFIAPGADNSNDNGNTNDSDGGANSNSDDDSNNGNDNGNDDHGGDSNSSGDDDGNKGKGSNDNDD